jgi:hypothetical protein
MLIVDSLMTCFTTPQKGTSVYFNGMQIQSPNENMNWKHFYLITLST